MAEHGIKRETARRAMQLAKRRDQITQLGELDDLTPAGATRALKAADELDRLYTEFMAYHDGIEARLLSREADGVPAWMDGSTLERQRDSVGLTADDVARRWERYEERYGAEDDAAKTELRRLMTDYNLEIWAALPDETRRRDQ